VRAVIYARFSTDRQSESTIADQLRVCRDHGTREGWDVVEEFVDQGISGGALGNRPAVLTLLEAAMARRFDALLVVDLTRLSRSIADLSKIIDRLSARGIRVVGVHDGYDSSRPGHKLQAGLSGILGEQFREMVSARTYSALESRAKAKRPTGGKAYGFDSKRNVVESEAAIVRELFARYANGESMKALASDLNARGVPSPGARWNRKERTCRGCWLVSALHAILHNEVYTGRVIWNSSQWVKDPDTGKRLRRERPQSEWIVSEGPALIGRDIWERCNRRLAESRLVYGNPKARPRYILSGLLECGLCGARMILAGNRGQRYVCSTYHHGGPAACANSLGVARPLAEKLILAPVRERVLSHEAVCHAIRLIREMARQDEKHSIASLNSGPARKLAELERLMRDGVIAPEDVQPAIARLRMEVEAQRFRQPATKLNAAEAEASYRDVVGELSTALTAENAAPARDMLRGMLGNVRLIPDLAAKVPYLTAHFERKTINLADFLRTGTAGGAADYAVVAGAGFEPATFGL
jgi:site-specific DNA recombinase